MEDGYITPDYMVDTGSGVRKMYGRDMRDWNWDTKGGFGPIDVTHVLMYSSNVGESLTAGWMILYEPTNKPGTSDVGLVVNPWVKKNITKNKEFWNLYSASNGAPVNGAPLRVLHTVVTVTNDEVIISTDRSLWHDWQDSRKPSNSEQA